MDATARRRSGVVAVVAEAAVMFPELYTRKEIMEASKQWCVNERSGVKSYKLFQVG